MNVHRSGDEATSLGARSQAEETVLADCSHSEPLGQGSPVTQPMLPVEPAAQDSVAHPAAVCDESSLMITRLVIDEAQLWVLRVRSSTWGR